MSILIVLLYALVVVVALLLVGLILIQPAKSGGMGAAFGGIGESVFGGKAGSHLTKATVVLTTLFFLLILILGALIGHGVRFGKEDGVSKELEAVQIEAAPAEQSVPAAPVAPAAQPAQAAPAPAK